MRSDRRTRQFLSQYQYQTVKLRSKDSHLLDKILLDSLVESDDIVKNDHWVKYG